MFSRIPKGRARKRLKTSKEEGNVSKRRYRKPHETPSASSPVPEFAVGVQLLACFMSEYVRKHMRAAPTLNQINAQARQDSSVKSAPIRGRLEIRKQWSSTSTTTICANILRTEEYNGHKKRKLGSPPKTACTASAAIAVTPGGNGKGTTKASDQFHTFARPSARDKTDTDLVDIFVLTLETFDNQMLKTIAAMKAARNTAP